MAVSTFNNSGLVHSTHKKFTKKQVALFNRLYEVHIKLRIAVLTGSRVCSTFS